MFFILMKRMSAGKIREKIEMGHGTVEKSFKATSVYVKAG